MSDLLHEALRYAVEKHDGQDRKGTERPYAVHPVAVGRTLERYGFDDEITAAGFLHDTVEDTEATIEDIEERFGEDVASLVDGASEHDKDAPWIERKRHTLSYLEEADEDVVAVTCADKLDNVRSMQDGYRQHGASFWDKFNPPSDDVPFESSREKQEWYYTSIVDTLDERIGDGSLAVLYSELEQEVTTLFDQQGR